MPSSPFLPLVCSGPSWRSPLGLSGLAGGVAWPDASPEADSICCSWELDLIGGQRSGSVSLIPTTRRCSAQLFFFSCLGCSLPEESLHCNRSSCTGLMARRRNEVSGCYPGGCGPPCPTASSKPELGALVLPGSAWAPVALLWQTGTRASCCRGFSCCGAPIQGGAHVTSCSTWALHHGLSGCGMWT